MGIMITNYAIGARWIGPMEWRGYYSYHARFRTAAQAQRETPGKIIIGPAPWDTGAPLREKLRRLHSMRGRCHGDS